LFTLETIARQIIACFSRQHIWRDSVDLLDQVVGGVKVFVRLGKVTNLQAGSQLGSAAVRRDLPQDGFEKGGFSGTVGSDECHTFAAFQNQVGTGEERRPSSS
jgi:hypothetical protein